MKQMPVKAPTFWRRDHGFTLIELIIVLAILGILATISISNFASYRDKAEYVAVRTTLKHLMDGEDFYLFENSSFYPRNGKIKIPKGVARDIPELAYSFPEGHKNRYIIQGKNNAQRNYYRIEVRCDFDSNNNGKKDRITAYTDIWRGSVRANRVVRQLK